MHITYISWLRFVCVCVRVFTCIHVYVLVCLCTGLVKGGLGSFVMPDLLSELASIHYSVDALLYCKLVLFAVQKKDLKDE